jgi:hypothetical protein
LIQQPVAVGLLVCETVIVDEKTKNVTPVNCFRRRRVSGFPSQPFPFVVFALLTDGIGNGTLEVVIQRLDTEAMDEIYQTRTGCAFSGPLDEVRCAVRIRDCSFPIAGAYAVNLLVDGELVAQRRLVLVAEE